MLDFISPQSLWLIIGFLLLIIEMVTTTFFVFFVAIGAFAAAILANPALYPENLSLQLIVCALVSVVGAIVLRKPIQKKFLKKNEISVDVGKEFQVSAPIPSHGSARIQYQGTEWQATNLSSENIQTGDLILIVGIDGNTLLVRKKQNHPEK